MKSTMVALDAGEVFVLTNSVLIPRLAQGSIASNNAVKSIAASTKRFAPYVFKSNAGKLTGTVVALVAAKTAPLGVTEVRST